MFFKVKVFSVNWVGVPRGILITFPTIVLGHVSQFYDVLAFLVPLAVLKGTFVFPAQCCFAAFTVNIRNSMKACQ